MKLEKIYSRDINRRINPVAVVSELENELIKQEIEEYVFTPQIYDFLYTVLNCVINEKEGRTGVWINGYYGSGKSHFLKFLYYSFLNQHRQVALSHFKESLRNEKAEISLSLHFTDNDLNNIGKKLESHDLKPIMFNIDAVSGDTANKNAITKVFLNQLNINQGYNGSYIALAKLERQLDKAGKFQAFKEEINKKFGEDWDTKGIDLAEAYLEDVLQIANSLIGIDESSTRASIERALNGHDELTVVNLVQDLKEYLSEKPSNFKLVFLVDEVSQYIGSNMNLLLNLQSIIEEVGSKCENKVWIICTAQQEIKDVAANTGLNEFGKIMARFETRISLQSQDYSDIIKKRILDKNSDGTAELSGFYEKNKNIISNQFIELHSLYQSFEDKEEFIASYPFVPYQFRLISDVFDSFSSQGFVTQGVKNTNRSLLGITHFIAKECKEENIGFFVPFDGFFNSQLAQNLTNLATNKLDRAYNADSSFKDKFARRVIHALFMLSYLKDNYQKNLPASLDNLIYLLMDKIDQDKLELQKKTEDVLEKLAEKAIIIKSDTNTYRFLGDDEIIVLRDIQNTKVTSDAFLDSFYKDILEYILDINRKVVYDGNTYDAQIKIDDKEISRNGDFKIQFAVTEQSDTSQMMLQAAPRDLVICLNHSMLDIRKDFNDYVQIISYIRNNSDISSEDRRKTLGKFKEQADSKLGDIKKRVEEKFLATSFISNSQIIQPASVSGTTAKTKFINVLTTHLAQVYKKKTLANSYAQNEEAFRKSAQNGQLPIDNSLTDAEREVNQVLDMLHTPVLSEVISQFNKSPYGWKDVATLDVLLQLAKKNKRKFHLLNEPLELKDFAEKALNSRERMKIEVLPEDVIDRSTLFEAVQSVNTIFNQSVLEASETDANVVFKNVNEFFRKKSDEADKLLMDTSTYPFSVHIRKYHEMVKSFSERRDKVKLFDELIKESAELKPVSDTYKVLREFIDEKIEDYRKIKAFTDEHAANFQSLEESDRLKGEKLIEYFQKDERPDGRFIEIKRIHQELSKALIALIKKLKEEALELYNKIFDRLETKQSEFGLDSNYLPDRDYIINRLKNLNNVSQLKLEISEATGFEQDNIQMLYNEKNKKAAASGKDYKQITFISVINEDADTTIEIKTEEELEAFLNQFRERALSQLRQNKIVGIKK